MQTSSPSSYPWVMPTLVMDPPPAEFDALVERREALGLDHRDEVWEGVLHMNPPPSYRHERLSSNLHRVLGPYADAAGLDLVGIVGIGVKENNRIPDLTLAATPGCRAAMAAHRGSRDRDCLAERQVAGQVRLLCRTRGR